MKRMLSLFLLALMLVASQPFAGSVQAQPPITVYVDGLPLIMDVLPIIENSRTLVPFRAIAEAMHITVSWDAPTRTVKASDSRTSVSLQIDSRTAYINSTAVTLEAPPRIVNNRTLIPLRFFSEAFNCEVAWDGNLYRASITTPVKDMTVIGFYALGDSQTSSWTDLFGHGYPQTALGRTDIVDELALGWYSIDGQGNLLNKSRTGWQRPEGWEKVLASAAEYGLSSEMVVHVTDSDGTITAFLKNSAAMSRAARDIASEARYYSGVNLDFEGLGFNDSGEQLELVQERFTSFVKLLNQELKADGRGLTLTLHAPNSAYPGYDYQALGQLADRIIVMAYDYGPKPEPEPQVTEAVKMSLASIPANKLILGISAPSETAASIGAKISIAKRYNLAGVALWRLGLIDDAMWQTLRETKNHS